MTGMIPGTVPRKTFSWMEPSAPNGKAHTPEEQSSASLPVDSDPTKNSPVQKTSEASDYRASMARGSRQNAAEDRDNLPISRREAFGEMAAGLGDMLVRGLRGFENLKRDCEEALRKDSRSS